MKHKVLQINEHNYSSHKGINLILIPCYHVLMNTYIVVY